MIRITPPIAIDERELEFSFMRAGGPGGQHVDKTATAVQLRFDAAASLPAPVRARLARLAGRRMTADGILVLHARRFRSQQQNCEDAVARLVVLLRQAARLPRPRRAAKLSAAAKRKRMEEKRRRGVVKISRRPSREFEW